MHNRIGRDGIHPWLGRALRTNRVLLQLKLTHNDIGDPKGKELLTALAPKPTTEEEQLKNLIARRKQDTAAGHTMTVEPLHDVRTLSDDPYNTTLTTLLLGNTGISDVAAEHLRHVLATNRTLTFLDIASNAFTAVGHQTIASGLAKNTTLYHLNYTDNRIDDEPAALALLQALASHTTIQTLLLQDCLQGNLVAQGVAALVRQTRSLTTLDLVRNRHFALRTRRDQPN
ncbi:hypothetical protein PINS_up014969 [Pythium insidiosum]|nr:hypothetical protein PINS_up014969 [Pythium insidiosum]